MLLYEKLGKRNIGTLNALELSIMLKTTYKLKLAHDGKELSNDDLGKLSTLNEAVELATILHSKQTRKNRDSYKKTPYIEHPLRNTLRILRWGVVDVDILVASLFHDIVEDKPQEFCRLFKVAKEDEEVAREHLVNYIKENYGERVSKAVKAVTNPLWPSDETNTLDYKHKRYKDFVSKSIHNNPEAFLVKLSDFVDNATGLWHGDDSEFIIRQIRKYRPMLPVYRDELNNLIENKELYLNKDGLRDISHKLDYTRKLFNELEFHETLYNSEV